MRDSTFLPRLSGRVLLVLFWAMFCSIHVVNADDWVEGARKGIRMWNAARMRLRRVRAWDVGKNRGIRITDLINRNSPVSKHPQC